MKNGAIEKSVREPWGLRTCMLPAVISFGLKVCVIVCFAYA